MSLHPLVGHVQRKRQLARALALGRLPQSLLLTGPAGVGKQRFGLWLAQVAMCRAPEADPCGACPGCRKVLELIHPDVHWFFPVPRPKAAEPDKQVVELEGALAEVLAERRTNPLYGPPSGMAGHFMATARLLQRKAALTPVEGRCQFFILGEAERLVPQEASQEAANALLKLIEEPPARTFFVLTTADPGQVLPTIRSRAVPIRLARLPDKDVEGFLRTHSNLGLSPEALSERVRRARGSIGMAIGEEGGVVKSRQLAAQLLMSLRSGSAARAEQVLKQAPWSARGEFTGLLDALLETLNEATRVALGQARRWTVDPEALVHSEPEALVKATQRVLAAREAAQGNLNPQLVLAALAEDLAAVL